MNRLFTPDNPVMQFITKLACTAYLNLLWFICCIPIVTAGASTTALYYVTLKMVKDEESGLTRAFFHSFKENFRQGTIIWLILLAAGIVLGIDGYVLYHLRFEHIFWTIITAIFVIVAIAYAIICLYIFPLLSRFSNSTTSMFKNSLMLGMRFLLCTVCMAVIDFITLFVIIRIFTPAIIFGMGMCAYFSSYFLSNIFRQCEEKSADVSSVREDSRL